MKIVIKNNGFKSVIFYSKITIICELGVCWEDNKHKSSPEPFLDS